jgi:hypothetical protein
MLRAILIIVMLSLPVGVALAAGTCNDQAADKKLAGAAKTSFLTKCEKDATATCDATATDKKIFGAAKTSFMKKCVADAVGS